MEKPKWKNNLKNLRKQRNLTQNQVAGLIGHRSNDRISHWEKGRMVPSLKNLLALAKVYDTPIEKLIEVSQQK